MSEREKELVEYPDTDSETQVTEYPQEDIDEKNDEDLEIVNTETTKKTPVKKVVKVNLRREKYIPLVIAATGEETKVTSSSRLRLFIGRIYYLPVDLPKEISTENLKVDIDLADKIDVKVVKNGYACVIPLVHNVMLVDGQRIAIITE